MRLVFPIMMFLGTFGSFHCNDGIHLIGVDSIVHPPMSVSIVGRLVGWRILVEESIDLRLVGMVDSTDFFF